MIDDDYRGYLLELMATKLLCLSQPVQVVGMSATLTVSTQPKHKKEVFLIDTTRI
jgi:replicative superfamily II helicase